MKFFSPSAAIFIIASAAGAASFDGVPNFQKVNDRVYRGGQPTSGGFKNLAQLGIRTVIDLREPGEHSQPEEQSWVTSSGMSYMSVPLKGLSAPPDVSVSKILAILNDPTTGPVFVHCRKGADRTGTIIACYRITHDHWENRKALQEARGYGMNVFERAMMHYVMHFTPLAASESAVAAQQ
jgi:uncharacterized protein (TIGR01244 family)